ncbi:MAG: alanine racemase [Proteobacteria bacterium]|nr:alanine racemase [Pseudomonadota bacterium]
MSLPIETGLHRSYCLIERNALAHNIRLVKANLAPGAKLAAVVKSNAYGHGCRIAWRAFAEGGADWMCVDSLHEAVELIDDGCTCPIFNMGYIPPQHAREAVALGVHAIVYNQEQVMAFGAASSAATKPFRLIIKLETGTQRQGLGIKEAIDLVKTIARFPYLVFEGICSHFANIEDTTDHSYAREQLRAFNQFAETLTQNGYPVKLRSIANSAATILWPETHFELARMGITAYGMWPSGECRVSAQRIPKDLVLRPALTWKTIVAQVKDVPAGAFIGYGCSYQTTHPSRIAILPVGYFDGYHRALSNLAHVLVHGRRAPVRGRICMNMCMADVTDIENVCPGDDVVLLGAQQNEKITAEQLASWSHTINYEITTQIQANIPRIPN